MPIAYGTNTGIVPNTADLTDDDIARLTELYAVRNQPEVGTDQYATWLVYALTLDRFAALADDS